MGCDCCIIPYAQSPSKTNKVGRWKKIKANKMICSALILAQLLLINPQQVRGQETHDVVKRLLSEMWQTFKEADGLFNQEKYTDALKLCKPMLTIEHAQGLFGPLATECALRTENYRLIASDPKAYSLSEGNDSSQALVTLKTVGFKEASQIELPERAVEQFVRQERLSSLLLVPARSARELEFHLLLRLSASSNDKNGKLHYLGRAAKMSPSNALPHLLFALERRDEQGRQQKDEMVKDYQRAWRNSNKSVQTYIRKVAHQKGLSMEEITGKEPTL